MRQQKSPLRGSVTQNTVSVRMRARAQSGMGFLTRLGLLGGGLLILGVTGVWLWHVGWPQHEAEKMQNMGIGLTQKAQFAVKDIIVEGRHMASKDEILDALGTEQGAPILSLDTKTAAEKIAKLPWIDTAVVERRLPDTVAVILTERVPAARWQHDDHLYVIDGDGHVLPSAKPENFPALPLVVGTGADSEAKTFLALLKTYPDIQEKTDSIVRVGERRWDLHLQPKITIKLPEQDVGNALHRLSVLISQQKILDRDIVSVDLRMPDRLAIEPAPGAKGNGDIHL